MRNLSVWSCSLLPNRYSGGLLPDGVVGVVGAIGAKTDFVRRPPINGERCRTGITEGRTVERRVGFVGAADDSAGVKGNADVRTGATRRCEAADGGGTMAGAAVGKVGGLGGTDVAEVGGVTLAVRFVVVGLGFV